MSIKYCNFSILFYTQFRFIFLCIITSLISCNSQLKKNDFEIDGHIKGIPTHYIYLANADNTDVILDSTIYSNDRFYFKNKRLEEFSEPFLACLYYKDHSNQLLPLYIIDNHKTTKGKVSRRNYFMTEAGPVVLNGSFPNGAYLKGGNQNKLFDIPNIMQFGYLPSNPVIKVNYLKRYQSIIKSNPNSFLLLNLLINNKENYSNSELSLVISNFSADVLNSKMNFAFQKYLKLRTMPNHSYPKIAFLDINDKEQFISYNNSKINVLVFWASWCGPCRMEIPEIKQLADKLKGKNVKIFSISIDENKNDWVKAIQFEKMNWTQIVVKKNELENCKAIFNFSAIPLLIITNSEGIEVYRTSGYRKDLNYFDIISDFYKIK